MTRRLVIPYYTQMFDKKDVLPTSYKSFKELYDDYLKACYARGGPVEVLYVQEDEVEVSRRFLAYPPPRRAPLTTSMLAG